MKFSNILIAFAIYTVNCVYSHPVLKNYTLEAIFEAYGYHINPEELGEDFQGDIIATEEEIMELKSGITDERKMWPEGVLIYEIADKFSQEQIDILGRAMEMISSVTCITFREKTDGDEHYVSFFHHEKKCNSRIGMQRTGGQPINIADWCFKNGGGTGGSVAHEMIHALGFNHEHTREDRDDFIYVDFENIVPDAWHNYKIFEGSSTYEVDYDYGSVMHYGVRGGFAKNPKKDILFLKQDYPDKVGQRAALSKSDAQKINRMYKCSRY